MLFKTLDSVLHKPNDRPLPPHTSAAELASDFARFFQDKVSAVESDLGISVDFSDLQDERKYVTELSDLHEATVDEVTKLIRGSPSKTCALDPVPTWLLKQCCGELAPLITRIVNLSFQSAHVPPTLKHAIITPALKKVILQLILKHYRPISNLAYVSKIMEKVACSRLHTHCKENNLHELLQSAYKVGHSTETALVKVQNDILLALDKQKVVCLMLLDLSAAFDTVNHKILLYRLEHTLGITGNALRWFDSYLSDRYQRVVVKGDSSKTYPLSCGVPQGSVLGPVLFTLYTSPLGDVIRQHGVQYHLYADDTQIYLALEPADAASHRSTISKLSQCVRDVAGWMNSNKLKLNREKTEIIMLGTPKQLEKVRLDTVTVGGTQLEITKRARNLGLLMDANMTLVPHVSSLAKSAHYHLRNLACIRKYLNQSTAEKAVHAFVTSRLDCGIALLFGVRKTALYKLQKVQNAAAKLIMKRRKCDHVTPLLLQLHWLPVKHRIDF